MKTVKEAALILGYKHPDSVRKAINVGSFKATKLGTDWFFTPYQLKQAMKWRGIHGRRKEQA